jgi:hypothetical protein
MTWISTNAWREVLARVFDGFAAEYEVSPDWLVNPDSKRRLKLDVLYPQIGVAVRFQGLQGPGRRQRPSLEEEHQQEVRDTARGDVCEAHGISLVVIDVMAGEPKAILRELSMALSNASRRLAKSDQRRAEKGQLIEGVSQARSRLDAIARRLRSPEDLKLYAELWQDRQYVDAPQPVSLADNGRPRTYTPGMAVRHGTFGDGVVQAVRPDGGDSLVTVRFADGTQKTFMASLVSDKLVPGE